MKTELVQFDSTIFIHPMGRVKSGFALDEEMVVDVGLILVEG